jgi:hypothetical protein
MNLLRRPALSTVFLLVAFGSADGIAAQKPRTPPPAAQKPKPKPAVKPAAAAKAEPPKPSGLVMRTTYTAADGRTSETKLTSDGIRQRIDLGDGVAVITQCDTHQILQVSDNAKLYVSLASDAAPSAPPATPARKGGVVEYVTTTTDTGEQKEIFGLPARRLTTVVTKTSSPDACDKKKERVETDGWYAVIPVQIACASVPAPAPAAAADCRDERHSSVAGPAPPGAPLSYTVSTFGEDGKVVSTVKMEVTALTLAPVDSAALAAPAGYARAADPKAFVEAVDRAADEERWGAPKAAGTLRIGVPMPANKSGQDISVEGIGNELLDALTVAPYEAVPILGSTPEEREVEVKAKACDYVLSLDLASLKSSTPSKVGGLMRKASGGGSPSELHEAKVEYKVFDAGSATPRASKSASAKTGSFTWKRALGVARLAARLYFGASTGMMRLMLSQTGAAGGGLPALSADPSLGAVSFVLNMLGGGAQAPVDQGSREATVIAVVHSAAADILKDLGAKKSR